MTVKHECTCGAEAKGAKYPQHDFHCPQFGVRQREARKQAQLRYDLDCMKRNGPLITGR